MKRKNEDWHGDAGLGRRGSEGVFDEGAQAIGIAVVIIAGDVVSHLPRRVAGDLDGGGLAWRAAKVVVNTPVGGERVIRIGGRGD